MFAEGQLEDGSAIHIHSTRHLVLRLKGMTDVLDSGVLVQVRGGDSVQIVCQRLSDTERAM